MNATHAPTIIPEWSYKAFLLCMKANIIRNLTLHALFKFWPVEWKEMLYEYFPSASPCLKPWFFSTAWFVCCDPNHKLSIFRAVIVMHGVAKQHWFGLRTFSVEVLSLGSKIQKCENHSLRWSIFTNRRRTILRQNH